MTPLTSPGDESPTNAQAVTSVTYHLFMLVVAVNALIVSTLYYLSLIVPSIPAAVREVLFFADTIHALLFLFDFGLRLKRAPYRLGYFVRWGWLDLITGTPGVPALRLLRLPRAVQVTRALNRHTPVEVRQAARQRLAQSSLLVVVGLVLLVVTYGSLVMVIVEANAPDATITSGGDAIWWAFVTIATVGYGDTYPVTGFGRLIGVLMLVAGVSLFSVLTSFLATTFIKPNASREEVNQSALQAEIGELKEALARLEARLAERDVL